MTKKNVKRVKKSYSGGQLQEMMQGTNEPTRPALPTAMSRHKGRGINAIYVSDIVRLTGRDDKGRLLSWGVDQPYFYLTIQQREDIARLCTPVFGIVTSRMNRISCTKFNVTAMKKTEDRIAEDLKSKRDVYNELRLSTEVSHLMIKSRVVAEVRQYLPDLLPDLSNFDAALLRWRRRIQNTKAETGERIRDWLMKPNTDVTWEEHIKKVMWDELVHGCAAIYKQWQGDHVENFDTLPGGTVFKFRSPHFSTFSGYVQVVVGFEPQIFFSREMMTLDYLPTSSRSYSLIPLEALINKVAESLLFDRLMAERADGTRPPEKLIIVTDNSNPFAEIDNEESIPLDADQQRALETKINEPRKNAIMTFSGNHAEVVDLSISNTMEMQNKRQKDVREEVALVFNASNVEVNLTGSDSTSGRETSETQQEVSQGKGILPHLITIEKKYTMEILQYSRWGCGFQIEFDRSKSEKEEVELDIMKQVSGELTVNELRESKNKPIFNDPKYNLPKGDAGQALQPDGTARQPFFTKPL